MFLIIIYLGYAFEFNRDMPEFNYVNYEFNRDIPMSYDMPMRYEVNYVNYEFNSLSGPNY